MPKDKPKTFLEFLLTNLAMYGSEDTAIRAYEKYLEEWNKNKQSKGAST